MNEPASAGPFGALHHIGIAVDDLASTSERIQILVSGHVIEEGEDERLGARFVWIASPGNPIIELVTATGDGPIAAHLSRHGQGLHHLSFWPNSLDAALGHTRRSGFRILGEDHDHAGYEEFFIDPTSTGGALFHSFRALSE